MLLIGIIAIVCATVLLCVGMLCDAWKVTVKAKAQARRI